MSEKENLEQLKEELRRVLCDLLELETWLGKKYPNVLKEWSEKKMPEIIGRLKESQKGMK